MSDQLKDGGPAFPWQEWINSSDPFVKNPIEHKGMTLRDWLAGQAVSGAVSYANFHETDEAQTAAEYAYRVADAMLKIRKEAQP